MASSSPTLDLSDFEPVDAAPVATLDMSDFEPVDAPALDMADFEIVPEQAGGATSESNTPSGPSSPVFEAPSAAPVSSAVGDFFKRIGAGIASGTADVVAAGYKAADDLSLPGAAAMKAVKSLGGPDISGATREFAQDVSSRAATDYGVDPARDKNLASTIASGIGSIIPTLASGPAASLTGGLMMAESGRREAEASGATAGQQDAAFYANAAVGALTEKLLGLPALLKSAQAKKIAAGTLGEIVKRAITQTVQHSAREGTQEGLEQMAGNIIASDIARYDPERPVMQGVGQAALAGAVIGGPVGGLAQVATDVDARNAQQPPAIPAPAPSPNASIDVIPDDFQPVIEQAAVEAEAVGASLTAQAVRESITATSEPAPASPAQPVAAERPISLLSERATRMRLEDGDPVQVGAIEKYGLTVPEGYTRKGEQYVREETKAKPAGEAVPPDGGEPEQRAGVVPKGGREGESGRTTTQTPAEKVEGFLNSITSNPMQRGKLKAALDTPVAKRTGGKIYRGSRGEVVQQLLDDGYAPKKSEASAIADPTRTQWNRMDNRQQQAFEKRKAAAGTKAEYTLEKPDGSFFTVTKAEYDLAKHFQKVESENLSGGESRPEGEMVPKGVTAPADIAPPAQPVTASGAQGEAVTPEPKEKMISEAEVSPNDIARARALPKEGETLGLSMIQRRMQLGYTKAQRILAAIQQEDQNAAPAPEPAASVEAGAVQPAEVGEVAAQAIPPPLPTPAQPRPSAQALGLTPKIPVISWITGNAKRLFTAQGDLPKPVFQKWVERSGRVAQEAKATQFAVKDLYDSVAEEFKISAPKMLTEGLASVPETFVDQMNTALSGDAVAMAALPPKVQAAVSKMRTHIDTLSEEMVRKGLVDSDLAAAISANQGAYLTRTYKIFEDAKWAEKIPAPIFNRARTYLHRQLTARNPAATVDDADRVLRNMLSDWATEAKDLRAKGGTLGAKDLTSFIKRKDIAPELREVMGENRNIIHNYATSVSKTARFIADQEFLNHVRTIGDGNFLFTADNAPQGFNTQIAAEGSQVLSPLNGLRTSPEIARAFEEWGKSSIDPGPILQALRIVNAWGKGVKTIGSILTQARNFTGQPFFFLGNGHFNMKPLKDAVAGVSGDLGLRSDAAARAVVLDAANHGLVGENAYAGEFREAWQEAMLNSSSDVPNEFAAEFLAKRLARKTIKGAEKLYQVTDELGKIVGWENEIQRLTEMNPGTPAAEIKRMAAERIRNTYPTYSQSPQALRTFRQQPFFGPFATFWYETFRTTFHNLRYGIEDLKGPTAAHKKAGAQRLAGTMAVLSMAGYGIQMATKALFGIDDKEEEDVRRMLPPWAQNAQLAFTGKEDKKYDFVNLSYMNPYSTLSDPAIGMISAFQRGEDADQIFGRGLAEVFRPFMDEQIATAAMVDVMRNQTKTGKKVYNPQDSWEVKGPAMFLHIVGAAALPGTIDRLNRRIIPALKGEVTAQGRAPEPAKEVVAEFTGVRFESLDMEQALQFKTGRFINDENDAEQIFRSVAGRRGTVENAEVIDAYRSAEESRFELWQDLYRDYRAALRSGVSESEAQRAMQARKLPRQTITDIADGRYRHFEPSKELTRKAEEAGRKLPVAELETVRKEIPTVLQDVGRPATNTSRQE